MDLRMVWGGMPPRKLLFVVAVLVLFGSSAVLAQDPAMDLWDLYKKGHFEEVESQGKALLNTGTESGSILLAVGRSLADMQRQSEALFFLQRAVAADKNKTWVYAWGQVYLGKCRYYLQETEAAREALISARDCNATGHATNEAVRYLNVFGLAESFNHWSSYDSEHFSLYFSPRLLEADKESYARNNELMYGKISAWFGKGLDRKIHFFVWADNEEAQQIGMPGLSFSLPENYTVHVSVEHAAALELTQLISHHVAHPVGRTGLISEGTAMFLGGSNGRNWLEFARNARAAQAEKWGILAPVPLSVMALWLDWDSQTHGVSLPVAAAFVSMLIEKGGRQQFQEASSNQSPQHFQEIYGDKLAIWIHEFDDALN